MLTVSLCIAGYILVAIAFMTAVYVEAQKREVKLGVQHAIVVLLWPFWLIWYLCVLLKEKWREFRAK
jgi:hypothetical protein